MTTEKDTHEISITAEDMRATHACTLELTNFISYIKTVDPELKGYEAMLVAAAIVNQLPDAFHSHLEMLADLKATCQTVKARRKKPKK